MWVRLAVLLLGVMVELGVDACSCIYISNHEKFCDNQLVIKGEVFKKKRFGDINGEIRYKVKVQEFRGSIKKLSVWSAGNDGICGVDLQKGQVYIFAMSKYKSRWWIQSCGSWVVPWSFVTDEEKLGINGDWVCPVPTTTPYVTRIPVTTPWILP